MKTTLRTIGFLIMAALGYGCADSGMDMTDEVEDTAAVAADKADRNPGVLVVGPYDRGADAQLGDFATLTVNADHSFARRFMVVDCLPAFTCHDEVGTYKISRSTKTGIRYIRFFDADGTMMDRYVYNMKDSSVILRRDDENRTFEMIPHHDMSPAPVSAAP
jgi:hypothetical protein